MQQMCPKLWCVSKCHCCGTCRNHINTGRTPAATPPGVAVWCKTAWMFWAHIWSTVTRFFPVLQTSRFVPGTRLATGRLWDEHSRHLGYPPKFYRVQDAISGNKSLLDWFCTKSSKSMFGGKSYIQKKKAPARKSTNSRPEWGCNPRWSLFQN